MAPRLSQSLSRRTEILGLATVQTVDVFHSDERLHS